MSILETTKNLATVPLNLVGGLFGNPFDPKGGHQAITTQSQRDYLDNLVNQQGGTSGVLSYDDYGTKFNLSDLKNPTAFSTAMTMGGTGWNKSDTGNITYTGGKYDFDGAVPFIDKGGLMGISHDLGGSIYDFLNPEDDPYAGIEGQTAFLGVPEIYTLGKAIFGGGSGTKIMKKILKDQARKKIIKEGKKHGPKIIKKLTTKKTPTITTAKGPPRIISRPKTKPTGPTGRDIHGGGGGQRGSNRGGFSDPGKGSYGPWKADGGLINFYRYGGFI